jgi:hypothetical protein
MLPESKLTESKAVCFAVEWGWVVLSNNDCVDGIDVLSKKTVWVWMFM